MLFLRLLISLRCAGQVQFTLLVGEHLVLGEKEISETVRERYYIESVARPLAPAESDGNGQSSLSARFDGLRFCGALRETNN